MQLIDGNAIAESIIEELTIEVSALTGKKPVVAFIRVGEDPASVSYVRKKEKLPSESALRADSTYCRTMLPKKNSLHRSIHSMPIRM